MRLNAFLKDTGVAKQGKDTAKMVFVKGATFRMDTVSLSFNDSMPIHNVALSDSYMDTHEVTNTQFASFVNATNYKTIAERPLDSKDYLGLPLDKLIPGSAVFSPPNSPVSLNDPMQQWNYVFGADWKRPDVPNRSFVCHENEPVTQVCYLDVLAYLIGRGKIYLQRLNGNMQLRLEKIMLIIGVIP